LRTGILYLLDAKSTYAEEVHFKKVLARFTMSVQNADMSTKQNGMKALAHLVDKPGLNFFI
jgi:hypothetical protein